MGLKKIIHNILVKIKGYITIILMDNIWNNDRSINPFGWSQIVLNCFTLNSDGNEILKGYECAQIPTSMGRHIRKVHNI